MTLTPNMTAAEFRDMIHPPKKKAKYRNKKVVIDGFKFDSGAEGRRYCDLKILERAGEISDLRLQPFFPLYGFGGTRVCKYVADFSYSVDVGGGVWRFIVEDVKGFRTPLYKLKAKLFADQMGFEIAEIPA